MERAGYPLYFPLLQRRHFTAGDSRRDASKNGGLYLYPFRTRALPSLAQRFQSRSRESFRKSLEEAHRGRFVHRHFDLTSYRSCSTLSLSVSRYL